MARSTGSIKLFMPGLLTTQQINGRTCAYLTNKLNQSLMRNIDLRTFEYFHDPSHGWIKVKMDVLITLFGGSWRSSFSPFSYEKGDNVYLEEDQDAATFIKRLKEKQISYKFRDRVASKQLSRIRTYTPLRPRLQFK